MEKSRASRSREKDADVLLGILQVGDGRLDGYFSTNYSHYLQEIAQKQTQLFLKVAAQHHAKDWKKALRYLVNESKGLPRNLERALEKVPKNSPEYSTPKRLSRRPAVRQRN
ncbi:MAG: hypothetical protein R3B54_01355 [Bdellovibrionota bacterium]